MEFGGNKIDFNILDAMKHPMEDHSVMHVNFIDLFVDNAFANFQNETVSDFLENSNFVDVFHCDCFGSNVCQSCTEIERTLSLGDFDFVSIFDSDFVLGSSLNLNSELVYYSPHSGCDTLDVSPQRLIPSII